MIGCGHERCGRQIDYVVVWIEAERDVVRDPEDAVASTDHSLLIPTVSKSEAWREFLLVQGQVIPTRVWTVADQQRVPKTRRKCNAVATSDGRVGHGRIPIAQAVLSLRPWSLKFIAES